MEKKIYVKPSVYMERFKLSQHIANCAWEIISFEGVCGYKGDKDFGFEDLIIINGETAGCDITEWIDYCETNGGEGSNTFDS